VLNSRSAVMGVLREADLIEFGEIILAVIDFRERHARRHSQHVADRRLAIGIAASFGTYLATVSSSEAIFFSVSAIPIARLTIDFAIECETKRFLSGAVVLIALGEDFAVLDQQKNRSRADARGNR